jgi:hypothetical protein
MNLLFVRYHSSIFWHLELELGPKIHIYCALEGLFIISLLSQIFLFEDKKRQLLFFNGQYRVIIFEVFGIDNSLHLVIIFECHESTSLFFSGIQ